jgi:hypothetical protein
MPIRGDLKPLYGADWPDVSNRIRFDRAKGRCERCDRPHGQVVIGLLGGGWIDPATGEAQLNGCPPADLVFLSPFRVVLSAAHDDHDPANGDDANLFAWCQRCHLLHDMPHHRAQRRITLRSRWALADLFDGPYGLTGYPRNV